MTFHRQEATGSIFHVTEEKTKHANAPAVRHKVSFVFQLSHTEESATQPAKCLSANKTFIDMKKALGGSSLHHLKSGQIFLSPPPVRPPSLSPAAGVDSASPTDAASAPGPEPRSPSNETKSDFNGGCY